ncbi:integrase [Curvibacter sp. HBC28]|uniref:Integrase n=1 Tax=Curvibacter microcysteis TaxID=3026419 RepID=A0ABT5MMU2_9BURK|nr:integrase [Curvibacter sp. HBC28]MDD0817172.1 integrase [Curvibacter sp. HBC28]
MVTYYFYDRRLDGEPDVPLGTDFDQAIKKWDEIHNKAPRIVGTLEEAFSRWEKEVLPTYTSIETKKGYAKNLRTIRPIFADSTWDQVDMPSIKGYLKARSAKTQGNREMSLLSIIWNWARGEGLTRLPWPAAGMERSKWKNKETPRRMVVTDQLFEALYAEGNQLLRDCMDLSTATGMRLTDCITVLMPRNDMLRLEASKTGKEADYDINVSQVLPELVARRKAMRTNHLMLLSTEDGKRVTHTTLRYWYDKARNQAYVKAALANDDEFMREIRRLVLRDMRKRAAQLAGGLDEASALLQHNDKRLTQRHYGAVAKLKPTR